ncbi:VOC family protein [Microbacterium oryzae]|uniref:VOC family protein n=1 Tax=Microbacterium oryzae TaxID=743009 RepID=UPI0025AFC09B|nr:VOC family protein [Microbacterium oryzae]MDN3310569.1 VOC family protein [Microbacterium oryzae]
MDQRVSLITLIVDDVAASRRFYADGLGWAPEVDVPGEVLMVRVGQRLLLSLWDHAHAEVEIGPVAAGGTPPVTLAHNVREPAEVDAVLALARAAGARTEPPSWREWGGYSGYFVDPDGFRWEVAVNPSPLGESLLP